MVEILRHERVDVHRTHTPLDEQVRRRASREAGEDDGQCYPHAGDHVGLPPDVERTEQRGRAEPHAE